MAASSNADTPGGVVNRMANTDGLMETESGEYHLTDIFELRREKFTDAVVSEPAADLRETIMAFTSGEAKADALLKLREQTPDVLAEYLALYDIVGNVLPDEDVLTALSALDSFDDDSPPAHGSPAAFLPVSGE